MKTTFPTWMVGIAWLMVSGSACACNDVLPDSEHPEKYSAIFVGRISGIHVEKYEHYLLSRPDIYMNPREDSGSTSTMERPAKPVELEGAVITNGAGPVTLDVVVTQPIRDMPRMALHLGMVGCTFRVPKPRERAIFFVNPGGTSAAMVLESNAREFAYWAARLGVGTALMAPPPAPTPVLAQAPELAVPEAVVTKEESCAEGRPDREHPEKYAAIFAGRISGFRLKWYESWLRRGAEDPTGAEGFGAAGPRIMDGLTFRDGSGPIEADVVVVQPVRDIFRSRQMLRLLGCRYRGPKVYERGIFFVDRRGQGALTVWASDTAEFAYWAERFGIGDDDEEKERKESLRTNQP